MYCNDCNKFFEYPVMGTPEPETGWVSQTCPHCGGDHFTESLFCPCGEEIPGYRRFCDDCLRKVSTNMSFLKNVLDYDQQDLEDIIATHFGW